MARDLRSTSALYRTLFLAMALLGATALPTAAAPVGVTSATDGDPLGKPPADAERVLRVGIDVQASEVITTKANDRAHLVFLDGTSLTVGPNALLTVDKFVFDPDTKKGELAINASKGVFRLVGGKISKTAAINITTPSSTIGIRGGITVFTVTPAETVSTFVFGYSMVVSGHGRSESVTRQGSQVTTIFGNAPGMPTLLPTGGLASMMTQFEGTNGNSNKKGDADRGAQRFGLNNSGKGPNFNSNYTFTPPNPNSNLLTNVIANTNGAENATGLSQPSSPKGVPAAVIPPPPPPPPYCPPVSYHGPSYGDGFRDRDGFRGRDGFRDGFRDGGNFAGRRH